MTAGIQGYSTAVPATPRSAGASQANQLSPNSHRGLASLSYGGNTLVFRTNPNSVWWSYTLLTNVEQTYGGRVVQILGTRIDDLVIKVDCGRGRWPYYQQVVEFMKDFMIAQRNGKPGNFTYTTRNWQMNVFAQSVPFADGFTSTVREIALTFKVQEDVSGTMSTLSIANELATLARDVGTAATTYRKSLPGDGAAHQSPTWMSPTDVPANITNMVSSIPGLDNIISGGAGVISPTGLGSLLNSSGLGGLGTALNTIPAIGGFI